MTATNLDVLKEIVEGCDLLIYAPPAYGKTSYIRGTRYDITPFDTDDLLADPCPSDSFFEVLLTNIPDLIKYINVGVSIAFLPSREQFKNGCLFRNLEYQDSWYDDACESVSNYDIVITSGLPILNYERFIYNCFNAYNDGEPMPKVPSNPSPPKKTFIPKVSYDEQLMFELGYPSSAGTKTTGCDSTVENRYTNLETRADSLPSFTKTIETVISQVSPTTDASVSLDISVPNTMVTELAHISKDVHHTDHTNVLDQGPLVSDSIPVLTPKKRAFFDAVLTSNLKYARCIDFESHFFQSPPILWFCLGAYRYFNLNTGLIRLESNNVQIYCSSAILRMLDPGLDDGRYHNNYGLD